jgi:hypothetical protein
MPMDRMIAFCGVTCTDCPAYVATQADDRDALERVLVRWREEFNAPDISVEDIICDGCLTSDGRLNGYCRQCKIRPCGAARGVINCAYCDEYACDKLERLLGICDRQEGFFSFTRKARPTLDGIRAELVT